MSAGTGEVRRVLVADADAGVRSLARLTLGADSYRVSEAAEAAEALQAIAQVRPELLLLDVALPGAGGIAICASLKGQPETQHARVVLLHPKSEPVDRRQAEAAGVDEYLAKPFTSFALLKKVGELLGDVAAGTEAG